jgi:NADPH:quinone reductase-like Zn-dependent oxidoreductase
VDERIVGHKPTTLDFAEAAAMPLTSLTAYELLFDRIGVKQGADADRRSLLIVGGSGGVGSIATQLARQLTGLTVIATASRPETIDWVKKLGAHHVVDHRRPLAPQLAAIGFPTVDIITAFVGTKAHAPEFADIVANEGHIGMIEGDGPGGFRPEAVRQGRGAAFRADVRAAAPRHRRDAPAARHPRRGGAAAGRRHAAVDHDAAPWPDQRRDAERGARHRRIGQVDRQGGGRRLAGKLMMLFLRP